MKTVKTFILLSISFFMMVTLNSCEKYEEGGRVGASQRRIVNAWKIDKAIDLEDGQDITADFSGEVWEFTKNSEYRENGNLKGTYTFSDDKLTLIILKTGGGVDTFKVLRLKSDELWLEEDGSEQIYLIPNN